VFMAGEEVCAATSEVTSVFFDVVKRESVMPTFALRAALEEFMQQQPA